MGNTIGQVLSFAAAVSLSPIPIIGVVLMLGTPRARVNGPAFLVGWIVGLTAVGTIVLLLSGGADASNGGSPASWVGWLQIVLGVLLVFVAARQWRSRPTDEEDASLPTWMKTVDGFRAPKATGTGMLLSAANPKSLLLTAGAAAAIAQTGASSADQAVALAVFVLVGTIGPAVPVVIYFVMGNRATEILARLESWLARENAVIMSVLCLIIGAMLLGDGISALG